jgi:hypothetical protein
MATNLRSKKPNSTSSTSSTPPPPTKGSKTPASKDTKDTKKPTIDTIKALVEEAIHRILPDLVETTFSDIAERYDALKKENDHLRTRVDMLEHERYAEAGKYDMLKKENDYLKTRVDVLENERYADQLEVSGVPLLPDEDVKEISKKVLTLLKLDETNVQAGLVSCYRLPKNEQSQSRYPPKLIIKLSNANLKRVAYGNRIKHPITSKDLGFQETNYKIFINERLRPDLRPVINKLLRLKSQKKINAVWTVNQRIMVKVGRDDTPENVVNYENFIETLDQ